MNDWIFYALATTKYLVSLASYNVRVRFVLRTVRNKEFQTLRALKLDILFYNFIWLEKHINIYTWHFMIYGMWGYWLILQKNGHKKHQFLFFSKKKPYDTNSFHVSIAAIYYRTVLLQITIYQLFHKSNQSFCDSFYFDLKLDVWRNLFKTGLQKRQ